jgi:YqxM protein
MNSKYEITKGVIFLISGFILLISAVMPQGTWSFFNDIEQQKHVLAVGRCDIDASSIEGDSELEFDLSYLIPKQSNSQNEKGNKGKGEEPNLIEVTLENKGTFLINEIYMHTSIDFGKDVENFASHLAVKVFLDKENMKEPVYETTLARLAESSLDITSEFLEDGLEVNESVEIILQISLSPSSHLKKEEIKKLQDNALFVNFDIEGICSSGGGSDEEEEDDNDQPEQWDKSSLEFIEQGREGDKIYAIVKNGQDSEKMNGSVTYEVFYIKKGNPKDGVVVKSGLVPALNSGQQYKITYKPGEFGNYKVKVYQHSDHPGKGELWSDKISFTE